MLGCCPLLSFTGILFDLFFFRSAILKTLQSADTPFLDLIFHSSLYCHQFEVVVLKLTFILSIIQYQILLLLIQFHASGLALILRHNESDGA